MNDRALPSMIEHINVIVFVNDKKHDRLGTEIERHIVANFGAWVTLHVNLEQPPTFNFGHADGGLGTTLLLTRRPSASMQPAATMEARLLTWVIW